MQAELRAKGGSPNLGPTRMPVSAAPVSQPIQRYAVNKYAQNRRSLTSMPKPDGISPGLPPTISPRIQPTPTSHISSPTTSITQSPNFLPQGGAISPSFGPVSQQNQQLRPPQQQQHLRPQFNPPQRPAAVNSTYPTSAATIASALTANAGTGPSYYPSPFQNHYEELGKYPLMSPLKAWNFVVLGLMLVFRTGIRSASRYARRGSRRISKRRWISTVPTCTTAKHASPTT